MAQRNSSPEIRTRSRRSLSLTSGEAVSPAHGSGEEDNEDNLSTSLLNTSKFTKSKKKGIMSIILNKKESLRNYANKEMQNFDSALDTSSDTEVLKKSDKRKLSIFIDKSKKYKTGSSNKEVFKNALTDSSDCSSFLEIPPKKKPVDFKSWKTRAKDTRKSSFKAVFESSIETDTSIMVQNKRSTAFGGRNSWKSGSSKNMFQNVLDSSVDTSEIQLPPRKKTRRSDMEFQYPLVTSTGDTAENTSIPQNADRNSSASDDDLHNSNSPDISSEQSPEIRCDDALLAETQANDSSKSNKHLGDDSQITAKKTLENVDTYTNVDNNRESEVSQSENIPTEMITEQNEYEDKEVAEESIKDKTANKSNLQRRSSKTLSNNSDVLTTSNLECNNENLNASAVDDASTALQRKDSPSQTDKKIEEQSNKNITAVSVTGNVTRDGLYSSSLSLEETELLSRYSLNIPQLSQHSLSLPRENVSTQINRSLSQPSQVLHIESDYDSMRSSSESEEESNNEILQQSKGEKDKSSSVVFKRRSGRITNSPSVSLQNKTSPVQKENLSSTSVEKEKSSASTRNKKSPLQKNNSLSASTQNKKSPLQKNNSLSTSIEKENSFTAVRKRASSSKNDSLVKGTLIKMALQKRNSKNSSNATSVRDSSSIYNNKSADGSLSFTDSLTASANASPNGRNRRQSLKNISNKKNSENETSRHDSNELSVYEAQLSELRGPYKRTKNNINDYEVINRILSFPEIAKNKSSKSNRNTSQTIAVSNGNENSEISIRENKQPKLLKPKIWVTGNLYKFIIEKLDSRYGIKARKRAEKFVIYLCNTVKNVDLLFEKQLYSQIVNELMFEMAKLQLIVTRSDFYYFVHKYLPHSFARKSISSLPMFGKEPLVDHIPGQFLTSLL